MKIFVLGTSHSGKTPFATRCSEALKFPLISASEWVKKDFTLESTSMDEYIEEITQYSVGLLREDFEAGVTFLNKEYDLSQPCVIDGERNPHDFAILFNPKEDLAISLLYNEHSIRTSPFETGLDVIWSYLMWLTENNFIMPFQDRRYSFDCLYESDVKNGVMESLEGQFDSIVQQLRGDVLQIKEVEDRCRALTTPYQHHDDHRR